MLIRPFLSAAAAAAVACGLATGCAAPGPRPTDEMVRAQTLIQQADQSGAQQYAAADLQRAKDEYMNAQQADGAKKFDDARRYAENAAADADLANARASAGAAEKAAHEIEQSNQMLRQESNRGSGSSDMSPSSGAGSSPNSMNLTGPRSNGPAAN